MMIKAKISVPPKTLIIILKSYILTKHRANLIYMLFLAFLQITGAVYHIVNLVRLFMLVVSIIVIKEYVLFFILVIFKS